MNTVVIFDTDVYPAIQKFAVVFFAHLLNFGGLMQRILSTGLVGFFLFVMQAEAFSAVPETLGGTIKVDGSSTVYPITEAVAEEFGRDHRQVRVTVGISGTGGGFKKFCAGEIDLTDASRPIKDVEISLCSKNSVSYVEIPVAYDAISVVVNPSNTWAQSITTAELKKIWEPAAQGKITRWNQVRAEWPDQPLRLFGPGVDSGTYDYFTEVIVGKSHSSRGDFTSSEDDNVLVQGVKNDRSALGFFGLAYFEENQGSIKALGVDDLNPKNGEGPQQPNLQNVISGKYEPLARPLFIYVRESSLDRPEVKQFVKFYIDNSPVLSKEVGYVPLRDEAYKLAAERLQKKVLGSIYQSTQAKAGMSLEELLSNS
ncbi:MAG: PstS family phosphate ABC transporter substrate-binding protein [Bdellovibrionales bacterium]|nr:PstS family phosphate ABC transporter substrate-binding protein [Bdellovibrionales bacterium]